MGKYIKTHSNYTLQKKHQNTNNGSVFERDFMTLSEMNGFTPGQLPIYGESNFKMTSGVSINSQKKYTYGKWDDNPNCGDVWSLSCVNGNILSTESIVKLKPNYNSITDFVYYGSALELIRASINEIITLFPCELYLTDKRFTVLNDNNEIVFLGGEDSYIVSNPFNIDLTTTTITNVNVINKLRYFCESFQEYQILDNNDNIIFNNVEWDVTNFNNNCPKDKDVLSIINIGNGITFTLYYYEGEKILMYKNDNEIKSLHIRPNNENINTFFDNLSDFSSILLNIKTNPLYKAEFNVLIDTDYGYKSQKESFIFPIDNGWNLDIVSSKYETYLSRLYNMGEMYDDRLVDNIWRSYTHESIKNFDFIDVEESLYIDDIMIGDGLIKNIVRICGRGFDDIKRYIDNIKSVNNITYDNKNNTPNYFLTDSLSLKGWEIKPPSPTVDNNTYIESPYPSINGVYNSVDANNEFFRRLDLNSKLIQKSKGTRKSIRMIMGLFGLEEDIDYSLDEHVVVAINGFDLIDRVEYFNEEKKTYVAPSLEIGFNEDKLQGLPVKEVYYTTIINSVQEVNRYIIPWFNQDIMYDGSMYQQMKGGWGKSNYRFISSNLTPMNGISGDVIYSESNTYINVVNNLTELTSISLQKLQNDTVYYVMDITDLDIKSSVIINNPSNYFILNDINKSNEISEFGWENISIADIYGGTDNNAVKILYLNDLIDDIKGNNPHCGYGNYDEGQEYIEYFKTLFKFSLENDNFNNLTPNEINEINTLGFNTKEIVDNTKTYYFNSDKTTPFLYYSDGGENYKPQEGVMVNDEFVNPIGGNINSEPTANSIINIKKMAINIINDMYFNAYMQDVILYYLKQVIPSTTIWSLNIPISEVLQMEIELSEANEYISPIYFPSPLKYEGIISWGDGFEEVIPINTTHIGNDRLKHIYRKSGVYTISLKLNPNDNFNFGYWDFQNDTIESTLFLKNVHNLNITNQNNLSDIFNNCVNLESVKNIQAKNILNMDRAFYNCMSLLECPMLDTSKVQSMVSVFYKCSSLNSESLNRLNIMSCVNLNNGFNGCTNITYFPSLNTENLEYIDGLFKNCINLKNIESLDFSKVISTDNFLMNAQNVEIIGGFKNLSVSFDLSSSPNLTYESLNNIINNLSLIDKGTEKVTFGDINFSKLKYEDIISTTNKGWDVDQSINFNFISGVIDVTMDNQLVDFIGVGSAHETVIWGDGDITTNIREHIYTKHGMYNITIISEDNPLSFRSLVELVECVEINTKQTTFQHLFSGCINLEKLPLTINTDNITHMGAMFSSCRKLKSEDIPELNCSNVTAMEYMFQSCESLTTIPLLNNLNKARTCNFMFSNCKNLENGSLIEFNTNSMTNSNNMFNGCSKLMEVPIINGSKLTIADNMFNGCEALTNFGGIQNIGVDVDFSTSPLLTITSLENIYNNIIDVTPNTKYLELGQNNVNKLRYDDILPVLDKGWVIVPEIEPSIEGNYIKGVIRTTTPNETVTYIGVDGQFDKVYWGDNTVTEDTKSHVYEVPGDYNITLINGGNRVSVKGMVSLIEVKQIVNGTGDFSELFSDCVNLEKICDINGYDYAINPTKLFFNCKKLLKIPNIFNSNRILTMSNVFYGCNTATFESLKNWDTSSAILFDWAFAYCFNIKGVDLENLKTNGCDSNFNNMFEGCQNLDYIPFIELRDGLNMSSMFKDCVNLETIALLSFSQCQNANNIVDGCVNLVNMDGFQSITVDFDLSMSINLNQNSLLNIINNIGVSDGNATLKLPLNSIDKLNYDDILPALKKGWVIVPEIEPSIEGNYIKGVIRTTTPNETVVYVGTNGQFDKVYWGDNTVTENAKSHVYEVPGDYNITLISGEGDVSLSGLTNLVSVSEINTKQTTFQHLFSGCINLEKLPLTINTDNITHMGAMFSSCRKLKSEDIPELNCSNVTAMEYMFSGCSELITMTKLNSTNNVRTVDDMFSFCPLLSEIDILDMSSVVSTIGIFEDSNNISIIKGLNNLKESIDVSNLPLTKESIINILYSLGDVIDKPQTIILGDENANKITYNDIFPILKKGWLISPEIEPTIEGNLIRGVIRTTIPNETVSYIGIEGQFDKVYWGDGYITEDTKSHVYEVPGDYNMTIISGVNYISVNGLNSLVEVNELLTTQSNYDNLFKDCTQLVKLPHNISMNAITSTRYMFSDCVSLESGDIPQLDCSNVIAMDYMFDGCNSLITPPILIGLNSNLLSVMGMFNNCQNLQYSPYFGDCVNIQNTSYIFNGCKKLKMVSGFSGTHIINTDFMFNLCYELTDITSNQGISNLSISLNVSDSPKLTYESLTNLINNLTYPKNNDTTLKLSSESSNLISYWDVSEIINKGWFITPNILPENTIQGIVEANMRETVSYIGIEGQFDKVDWGDGYITEDTKSHVYRVSGRFNVIIYNNSPSISLKGFTNLIEVTNLSTTNTNASGMFENCRNLKRVNILDETKVVPWDDTSYMFSGCNLLEEFIINDENITKNISNASYMFSDCFSINRVDFNLTNKIKYLDGIFSWCYIMSFLNNNWDCSNLISINNGFYGCEFLGSIYGLNDLNISLDLSSCDNLTYDSLLDIITSVEVVNDGVAILTLPNRQKSNYENLPSLTKEDFTNKNWEVLFI